MKIILIQVELNHEFNNTAHRSLTLIKIPLKLKKAMYMDCFFVLSFQDAKNILVAFEEKPDFLSVSRRSTWQYHNGVHQWMRFIRMNKI